MKFGWYKTSAQWTRLATTVMMFLSGSPWKDRSSKPCESEQPPRLHRGFCVNWSVSVWMRGLKYNFAGNTIDPISLLLKRFHIAHVHERQRHPDCVLPDDGSISQNTHRTHRRTIRRVCPWLPDLVQKGRPLASWSASFMEGEWTPKTVTRCTVLSSFSTTLIRS